MHGHAFLCVVFFKTSHCEEFHTYTEAKEDYNEPQ